MTVPSSDCRSEGYAGPGSGSESARGREQAADARGTRFLAIAIACGCFFAFAAKAWADFAPPRLVTQGTGGATQTATGLDLANNAYISTVVNEKIRIKILGPSLDVDAILEGGGLGQGDPDFATSSRAVTYMCFSQIDDILLGGGREIYLTDNNGGQFSYPVRITSNKVDDFGPKLILDRDGEPHLVWTQRVGGSTRVLYWDPTLPGGLDNPSPLNLVSGVYPALFVDPAKGVHLVYSRDNDLYYGMLLDGVFTEVARVTKTIFEPEASASIGGDPEGNVLIAYESRNSLYFATRALGADFAPPRLIDTQGVLDPRMRVRSLGQVLIVYEKRGDVYFVQGQSMSLNQPQRITDTPEIESHPSLEIDLSNNYHLSYVMNGEVYYTNNAASPTADFSAVSTSGEVPFSVRFADLSNGDIQVWEWDFGDGGRSGVRNPVHVYEGTGKYSVSLKVTAPGATESTRVREDYIFVQDPFNTLRISDQLVLPGQTNVWFPVIASHKDPIQAFQLMGLFDPNYLVLKGYELNYTAIAALTPEVMILNNPNGTYFEVGCIFDFEQPIDKPPLVAGVNQTILNLIFDISENAPQGAETQVRLVNDRELSAVLNIFTVGGFTKVPALTPSTVRILIVEPPYPKTFLRGDVDGNRSIDITDAVRLLNYLFLGGVPPLCFDAADVTDSGRVDISGAISILNYLFLGGSCPSVPFPVAGFDPTEDALPLCQ